MALRRQQTPIVDPAAAWFDLRGLRVLLVEDDPGLACELVEALRETHAIVVGPAATMKATLERFPS
jgi:hypothetical protein